MASNSSHDFKWFRTFGAAFLICAGVSLSHGQVAKPINLVTPDGVNGYAVNGEPEFCKSQAVAVNRNGFHTAMQLETIKTPPNDWDVEVLSYASAPIKAGDVILVSFDIRCIKGQPETGEGKVTLDYQIGAPDWTKSVTQSYGVTSEWRHIDVPFKSLNDAETGKSMAAFRLGYGTQTVQIGGIKVMDYGPIFPIEVLPRTRLGYRGMEADAKWRVEALKRIDQIRRGNLRIKVVSAQGKVLHGVKVSLACSKLDFGIGTAIAADELQQTDADAKKYKQVILDTFSQGTVENHLKWPFWETWGKKDGLAAVKWMKDSGLRVRGHNLMWGGWSNLPDDIKNFKGNPTGLKKRIEDHLQEEVGALKGQIDDWDVVNETYANHDVMDIVGWDQFPRWFDRVHELDPKPVLTLNDYPPLDGSASTNPHLAFFENQIKTLKAANAPIGSIGFQGHFGSDPIAPVNVLSCLDRFAKLGLPIEITEFDMNTTDEQLQARYTRDLMIAFYSHPSVSAVTFWGF